VQRLVAGAGAHEVRGSFVLRQVECRVEERLYLRPTCR